MAMRPVRRTLKERLAQPDAWPTWPLLHVQRLVDAGENVQAPQDGTIHARMGIFRVILVHPEKTGIKNLDEFDYIDYPNFEDLEEAGWKPAD